MSLRFIAIVFFYSHLLLAAPPAMLRIGNAAEPRDLDPQLVTGVPEGHILINLFEGLVGKAPKTAKPIPGVAERWTFSRDGKQITFKLRHDAKWSNGDAVTARDFVYSWTRLLNPATAAEYAYFGYYFKGGRDYNHGEEKDPSALGFTAIDDFTLLVTLEHPTPFFLSLLFHHSLYPVHRATIEKYGAKWTRPEHFVGNGPFVLAEWKVNQLIRLKKSTLYWDRKYVRLDEADFYPIDKMTVEEAMFRSGMLDITNDIPPEKLRTWQKAPGGVYQEHPFLGTYFYWLNVTRPPLDNKLVRKALALAIDRETLVKYVTRGGQRPGTSFTPPGSDEGYTPPAVLPADDSGVTTAKKLLAEAGYPDGRGFPSVELLYNTSETERKIAEALQGMWKRNLGIGVRLFNQEWKVYLDAKRTRNFQICRGSWIGDYHDPNTFLEIFRSGAATNAAAWSSPAYDKLLAGAQDEPNPNKRMGYLRQAETLLLEELPVIPIYLSTKVYLKSPRVLGWYPNLEDVHPLKFVSLTPAK